MIYDRRFGLPQNMVDYLNQPLPNISGIFGALPQYTAVLPNQEIEKSLTPTGLTPEQLALLYPQNNLGGGDGGGFNPYGVDSTDPSIRTPDQYNPYSYRQAAESRYVGDLYPTETGLQKHMESYPEYYGVGQKDPAKMSGLERLINQTKTNPLVQVGMALVNPIGFAAKSMVSGIANALPVHRRAILENELLGQGIMLDDVGRVVTTGLNYKTPEGIMAGYNANKITEETFDRRKETIAKTLREKYGMSEDQIEKALNEEYTGPVPINPFTGKPTDLIDTISILNQAKRKFLDAQTARDIIAERKEAERIKKTQKKNEAKDKDRGVDVKKTDKIIKQTSGLSSIGSGGGGGRDTGATSGPSSGTGRGATSATSSGLGNLGFSDKRLKENIELIGKSPSNINIYKFNYKNNPTTYQGVMADEVSWASVKHPNGYMMVDYNKIDVEFKKI